MNTRTSIFTFALLAVLSSVGAGAQDLDCPNLRSLTASALKNFDDMVGAKVEEDTYYTNHTPTKPTHAMAGNCEVELPKDATILAPRLNCRLREEVPPGQKYIQDETRRAKLVATVEATVTAYSRCLGIQPTKRHLPPYESYPNIERVEWLWTGPLKPSWKLKIELSMALPGVTIEQYENKSSIHTGLDSPNPLSVRINKLKW